MRLAYQVTLTAAGDEINKIMRFRQRERKEKGKRSERRGQMKETDRQKEGKKGLISFWDETGR